MSVALDAFDLTEPNGRCPVETTRPAFRWRSRRITTHELAGQLQSARTRLQLRLWRLGPRDEPAHVMRRRPTRAWWVDPVPGEFSIPARDAALEAGTAWTWQLAAVDAKETVLATTGLAPFFVDDPGWPVPLAQLLCCGRSTNGFPWVRARGAPSIDPKAPGFFETTGVAGLSGGPASGDAITRALPAAERITAGRHYVVSFAARAVSRARDDVRFRVIAHTAPLPESGGHPPGSPDRVVVAETAALMSRDWTWIVLPPWRAPRDFGHLAIAAFADLRADDRTAGRPPAGRGEVSAICVREVDGCTHAGRLIGRGPQLSFADDAEPVADGEPPTAQLVSSDVGALVDILGEPFTADGASRWYRPGDDCVSLGGWLPDGLREHVPWLNGESEVPPHDVVEDLVKAVLHELTDPDVSALEPIRLRLDPCERHDPAPAPAPPRADVIAEPPAPFAGRDIVFVHGFVPSHLVARYIADDPTAAAAYAMLGSQSEDLAGTVANIGREWPADPDAFRVVPAEAAPDGVEMTGFFRGTGYWNGHLRQYFREPGHPNRYIVAGYNSSQRLIFSAHALLAQIAEAMSTGAGVRTEAGSDRADARCFGIECVVVSHSTGALVTCVALALAARSATDPAVAAVFGDVSVIAERARLHLSLHGAAGGSELATVGLAGAALLREAVSSAATDAALRSEGFRLVRVALRGLSLDSALTALIGELFDAVAAAGAAADASAQNLVAMLLASVAVDLSPLVARTRWLQDIGACPVPTLTVAGGHPSFGGLDGVPGFTKAALPGFDDGVVSTNSQSGSNSAPTGLADTFVPMPPPARLFDMGLPIQRAAPYFVEQDRAPLANYGTTPWLSPSGMVQPVLAAPAVPRHTNHFAFLQVAGDHGFPTHDTQAAFELYAPTAGRANYEESLVIEKPTVFAAGLVAPAIAGFVRRFERRLDVRITLRLRFPLIRLRPPGVRWIQVDVPVQQTVWRRFYDLLTAARGPDAVAQTGTRTIALTIAPGGTVALPTVESDWPLLVAGHIAGTEFGECGWAYRFVLPA